MGILYCGENYDLPALFVKVKTLFCPHP